MIANDHVERIRLNIFHSMIQVGTMMLPFVVFVNMLYTVRIKINRFVPDILASRMNLSILPQDSGTDSNVEQF